MNTTLLIDDHYTLGIRREVAQLAQMTEDDFVTISNGVFWSPLLLHELSQSIGEELNGTVLRQIEMVAEKANNDGLATALHHGLAGLGWVVQYMKHCTKLPWANEYLKDLDDTLLLSIDSADRAGHLNADIVSGCAGIAVYAAARMKDGYAEELAAWLIRWFTKRFSSTENNPPLTSDMNLGMAHGLPGVLSAFRTMHVPPQAVNHMDTALKKISERLWSFHNPSASGGAWYGNRAGDIEPARLAWCYGNLGPALVYSSQPERSERLVHFALDQYQRRESRLSDPFLCHGYSGAALVFATLADEISNGFQKDLLKSCAVDAFDRAAKMLIRDSAVKKRNKSNKNLLLNHPAGAWLALCATDRILGKDAMYDAPLWLRVLGL